MRFILNFRIIVPVTALIFVRLIAFASSEILEKKSLDIDENKFVVEKHKDFFEWTLNDQKVKEDKYFWKVFFQGQEIGTIQCEDNPRPGSCSRHFATWHKGDASHAKTLPSLDGAVQYLAKKELAASSRLTDTEWNNVTERRFGVSFDHPAGKSVRKIHKMEVSDPFPANARPNYDMKPSDAWNSLQIEFDIDKISPITISIHKKKAMTYDQTLSVIRKLFGDSMTDFHGNKNFMVNGVKGYEFAGQLGGRIQQRWIVIFHKERQYVFMFGAFKEYFRNVEPLIEKMLGSIKFL